MIDKMQKGYKTLWELEKILITNPLPNDKILETEIHFGIVTKHWGKTRKC